MTNALLITAAINFVLNGGIAWLSARGMTSVPLTPSRALLRPNLMTDTVGTLFLLPFITSLLCTTAVWQQLRRGQLPAAPAPTWRRPSTRRHRGLLLGAICLALAPGLLALLAAAAPDGLQPAQFALYKALLGLILGALVTPVIAMWALTDSIPVAAAPA